MANEPKEVPRDERLKLALRDTHPEVRAELSRLRLEVEALKAELAAEHAKAKAELVAQLEAK